MGSDQRPTSVTVIGWLWILAGSIICTGGIIGLSELPAMQNQLVKEFLSASAALAVGVVGIISAIYFLRLRYWARTVLEVLTWLVLAFTGGFAVLFLGSFGGFGPFEGIGTLETSFVVLSAVILVTYAAPFAIVLYHLRSDKLKNALRRGGQG